MNQPEAALPRIIGTETEFNPVIFHGKSIMPLPYAALIVPENIDSAHGYTSNGARFYMDWNSIPEYATPECAGPADAVHAEMAGEVFIINALSAYLRRNPEITAIDLHKRVVSDPFYTNPGVGPRLMGQRRSWGHHENYLLERRVYEDKNLRLLVMAHLASRALLVGAGYWRPTADNPLHMLPAQKLLDLEAEASRSTTCNKPLLNLRDEEHAAHKWARLHITSGDSNITPWSSWLKLGSTSLILRLGESGASQTLLNHLPKNMLGTAKRVARRGNAPLIELRNGAMVRPIDIQETLLEACEILSPSYLPKEEHAVLYEWRRAIDDFRHDPRLLHDRTEWVARQHWLEQAVDKLKNKDNLLQKISTADQLWDNMSLSDDSKKHGIGFRKRSLMGFPGYSQDEADRLVDHPPKGTRAVERAGLIRKLAYDKHEATSCSWDRVNGTLLMEPRGNNTGEQAA